jgi:hypothetical protein
MPHSPTTLVKPLTVAMMRFLPTIREKAALTRHAIGPHLRELEDQVAQLQSLLEHEIEKIELSLEKADWQARVDLEEISKLRDRLNHLRSIREQHTTHAVGASVGAIDAMIASLEVFEKQSSK